jgi:hypothetical protein
MVTLTLLVHITVLSVVHNKAISPLYQMVIILVISLSSLRLLRETILFLISYNGLYIIRENNINYTYYKSV